MFRLLDRIEIRVNSSVVEMRKEKSFATTLDHHLFPAMIWQKRFGKRGSALPALTFFLGPFVHYIAYRRGFSDFHKALLLLPKAKLRFARLFRLLSLLVKIIAGLMTDVGLKLLFCPPKQTQTAEPTRLLELSLPLI